MSNHNRLMVREVVVGVIIAGTVSTVGAGVGVYVASAQQEQRITTLEGAYKATAGDHEMRIRSIEQTLTRLDGNVQWIKEELQRRRGP